MQQILDKERRMMIYIQHFFPSVACDMCFCGWVQSRKEGHVSEKLHRARLNHIKSDWLDKGVSTAAHANTHTLTH